MEYYRMVLEWLWNGNGMVMEFLWDGFGMLMEWKCNGYGMVMEWLWNIIEFSGMFLKWELLEQIRLDLSKVGQFIIAPVFVLFKNRASEQNVMNRSVQKVKSPSLYLYSVQYSTSTVPLLSLDRPWN